MNDIKHAKDLLKAGGYTCTLCKGGAVYTSKVKGVSPMIDFLAAKTDLRGFSAADKIIGKAAAMLFALAGVKEVYAEVLSKHALSVLTKYNIKYSYGELTEVIVNRTGTGSCPMEQAVENIDDAETAFDAIKQRLQILKANK